MIRSFKLHFTVFRTDEACRRGGRRHCSLLLRAFARALAIKERLRGFSSAASGTAETNGFVATAADTSYGRKDENWMGKSDVLLRSFRWVLMMVLPLRWRIIGIEYVIVGGDVEIDF